mmetsp:Transcript_58823/g.140251  ORF Transcript_58823/g.140251 Transcript_58823/m.140251 type:complete len:473 (+) Transcript_58823:96-1514(+)
MANVVQLPPQQIVHKIDARDLAQPDAEASNSAGPARLRVILVCKDPEIAIIPNFVTPAEAQHLMDLAEGHWIPSLIAGQGSSERGADAEALTNLRSQTRTSRSCMLRPVQSSVVEHIEQRCSSVAGLPVENLERLTLVRYAPGEFFSEHHDGRFRPKTIFVYLNELPDDDEGGDTVFARLGISFRPRTGCAVMWRNATPDGQEDSRMLHEGRAPNSIVKYGVNCFFNDRTLRILTYPESGYHLEDVDILDMASLGPDPGKRRGRSRRGRGRVEDAGPSKAYVLKASPKVIAVPGLLTEDEVDHLVALANVTANDQKYSSHPYYQGTVTLHILDHAETPILQQVEERVAAVGGHEVAFLAKLRVVRVGLQLGLCNRGCGPKSGTVCLSQSDEVFFPVLGLRVRMHRGDFLLWSNVDWQDERPVEDLQTLRVHMPVNGGDRAIGLDTFFHDTPVRDLQLQDRAEQQSGGSSSGS